jgi:hypothetical protein
MRAGKKRYKTRKFVLDKFEKLDAEGRDKFWCDLLLEISTCPDRIERIELKRLLFMMNTKYRPWMFAEVLSLCPDFPELQEINCQSRQADGMEERRWLVDHGFATLRKGLVRWGIPWRSVNPRNYDDPDGPFCWLLYESTRKFDSPKLARTHPNNVVLV